MENRPNTGAVSPPVHTPRSTPGYRRRPSRRRGGFVNIDRFFLAFAFLIPLLPRPTIESNARWLAPAAIGALLAVFLLWQGGRRYGSLGLNTSDVQIALATALVIAMYGIRIALSGSWEELPFLASRAALLAGSLLILQWLRTRGLAPERVLQSLFFGFLLVSSLVVFVGLTGIEIFETPRPARTFGVEMPFSKTVGIPRSYGELGVLASASWAFFLVFYDRFRFALRLLFAGILLLAVVISQSRNVYLGILIVTVAAVATRWDRSHVIAALTIPAAFLVPLIVSLTLPTLREVPLVNALVGEGVYEQNVYSRQGLQTAAWRAAVDDPASAFVGFDREAWFDYSYSAIGKAAVPHNHFLANLLFLGLLGGGVSLVVLYAWPLITLLRFPLTRSRSLRVVYLAFVGAIVNLNFYDGWFSPAVMLELGLLWYVAFADSQSADRQPIGTQPASGARPAQSRSSRLRSDMQRTNSPGLNA